MIFAVACAAVGGSFGAALRSLFSSLLNDARGGFPFGTFASNMLSSFILGALMAFDDAGVLNKYADMLLEAGFAQLCPHFHHWPGKWPQCFGAGIRCWPQFMQSPHFAEEWRYFWRQTTRWRGCINLGK